MMAQAGRPAPGLPCQSELALYHRGMSDYLLGGMPPEVFLQTHWQQRPCVFRGVMQGPPPVDVKTLLALATQAGVECRLVSKDGDAWQLQHGPFKPKALPSRQTPGWTLLVQGVDLHVNAVHDLLKSFTFLPWARLDDVMVSYASEGGGVGPHTDAYDVFLLQLHGRRTWRVGEVPSPRWRKDVPLKQLRQFKPTNTWTLEPGDMLYVPPGWGHDGVAVGSDCVTASIGFRAPLASSLAADLLARLADECAPDGDAPDDDVRYQDPPLHAPTVGQQAVGSQPGRIPAHLVDFARTSLEAALQSPERLHLVLGESLTEPKPSVWFDAPTQVPTWTRIARIDLDRRSRMLYDAERIYLNGEAFDVEGADGACLRQLADERGLAKATLKRLSASARAGVMQWVQAGWLVAHEAD